MNPTKLSALRVQASRPGATANELKQAILARSGFSVQQRWRAMRGTRRWG